MLIWEEGDRPDHWMILGRKIHYYPTRYWSVKGETDGMGRIWDGDARGGAAGAWDCMCMLGLIMGCDWTDELIETWEAGR